MYPKDLGRKENGTKGKPAEIKSLYIESQRKRRRALDTAVWFAAQECVREAPGSASVLETVTTLFPASRSFAVPLSARGPKLHFSNAQITQF